MKIAHQGPFLAEGLRELGHELFPLRLDGQSSFDQQVEAVCPAPDLVIIEHMANRPIPPDIGESRRRLVAYCIDSCLSEFVLCDYMRLFDKVFVDQPSSVAELKKFGIEATWLPLCVSGNYFRAAQNKEHDITFVGRLSPHRVKRGNLLRLIQKHFHVNIVEGVSEAEMQDIFARSKIVLNENLFSGLTLRVLQGLASGSLVLTEADGDGVSAHFTDGTHLLCFTPQNIIELIRRVLDNYSEYEGIAAAGQAACLAGHTSAARAAELLSRLAIGPGTREPDPRKRRLCQALAIYSASRRYSGGFADAVNTLEKLNDHTDECSAQAALALGGIAARRGHDEAAARLFTAAFEQSLSPFPLLKLAMLWLYREKIHVAQRFIRMALSKMPAPCPDIEEELQNRSSATGAGDLFLIIARLYFLLQRPCQVGYLKNAADKYPDSALETAFIAWDISPSPKILDFMLACCKSRRIEGELLPIMTQAVEEGIATQAQAARASEIALSYYDLELAAKLGGKA